MKSKSYNCAFSLFIQRKDDDELGPLQTGGYGESGRSAALLVAVAAAAA